MRKVAYFGHNVNDAAVRRRVQAFRDDGVAVTGFMQRRGEASAVDWMNIDLGETFDAALVQRVKSIFTGARRAAAERSRIAEADVIVARNLDMLATAFLAKRLTGLDTPVIYECLDIHRLLTRNDPVGFLTRRMEGFLLARCRSVVVSSPGFLENYFEKRHKGRYRAILMENKHAAGGDYGPRPQRKTAPSSGPLRLGWVGILRCSRSLDLLLGVARQLGDKVRIVMHGQPALTEIPDFHARIQGLANVEFHGRYTFPTDLARIYSGIDVVWAGDFMEAGYNSVWLLPNRLYEGGYFAVPPIAPSGTQTAKWIDERGVGFSEAEDLSTTLPALIERLVANRDALAARRSKLLDLPVDTFVHPRGAHLAMIEASLAQPARIRAHGQTGLKRA
ncbi:MAG: glycosyl transferase [Alphaproteobacteria bacterium]|nr:glycosyl transferase [Alphaproteobacteria bacterium]